MTRRTAPRSALAGVLGAEPGYGGSPAAARTRSARSGVAAGPAPTKEAAP
ncbi:hypothetical protein [Streptomyces tendae]